MQKLAIDAHLGCPNRDGTIAHGGCTFCLDKAFSPAYKEQPSSITQQIDSALHFHAARRRTADTYLAYFQTGTNTYASVDRLKEIYIEALAHPAIKGIIVGTRPDCITSEKLDLLEHLSHSKYVAVEYGIESTNDDTLRHINRHHTFVTAQRAIALTRERGIDVGVHLILGLPFDDHAHILESILKINSLGINYIKFHQLQIYRGTAIATEWLDHPERFSLYNSLNAESYADLLVDILRHLNSDIAVDRFVSTAPHNLVLHSPLGGIRPDTMRSMVIERLTALNAQQGDALR